MRRFEGKVTARLSLMAAMLAICSLSGCSHKAENTQYAFGEPVYATGEDSLLPEGYDQQSELQRQDYVMGPDGDMIAEGGVPGAAEPNADNYAVGKRVPTIQVMGEEENDVSSEKDGSADKEADKATFGSTENNLLEAKETEDAAADSGDSSDSCVSIKNRSFDASSDEVTVIFGGDVLFSRDYAILYSVQRNGGISGVVDKPLLDLMQGADLCMVNNEFPYTTGGAPLEGKEFTFHADYSSVSYLRDMGVDLVSIANNHIFDYGEKGLLDTLSCLEDADMPYVGAGRNIDEASETLYFTSDNGIRLAFISGCDVEGAEPPFTRGATESLPGVFRVRKDELLCQRVREAKQTGAVVIVYMHWGIENTTELNWLQMSQAKDLSAAGADLIIGDHPHCLQGIDYVGDVPVIYSLGNYLFNSKTLDTGLIEATFAKEGLKSWRFIPAIQSGSAVRAASPEEKARIISYMQSLSPNVIISQDGVIDSLVPRG
ncbi:CapA family protein [Butyrivibrio sp. MC2013]|uniref:CapA family protein n=1 Tax=Butyrivibrio sp. MC2013 TaxID=1280686 RepID=UPI0003F5FB20|nr:CapA family protein [Butyrivibrio sp. MC2013]